MITLCTFMALLGLLVSTVGVDATEGTQRFMFGNLQLLAGLSVATVLLGVFAMSDVLSKTRNVVFEESNTQAKLKYEKARVPFYHLFKYWKTLIKSALIGIFIGATPGTGGTTSAMFCYNEARRSSKHPEEFGSGSMEGIIAPETGNNAVTGATLIPLLTLGIPGDAPVAILLGALTMQGITPGASLFSQGSIWVYCIMGGLVIINIFMLLEGRAFIRGFANIIRVPVSIMIPCIVVMCVMGSFSIGNRPFEIFIMLGFTLFGFVVKRFNFPVTPFTIALVLGQLMEKNLRRSLILSAGSPLIFVTRPISLVILILSVLTLLVPVVRPSVEQYLTKRKASR